MTIGSRRSSRDALTPELRELINAYLFKSLATVGTVLGVVNIGALLVGLAYIFFVIPERLAAEAKVHVENRVQAPISELQKTLTTVVLDALSTGIEAKTKSRLAHEEAEKTREEAEKTRLALSQLTKQTAALSRDDSVRVVEAAETLKKHPEFERALRSVSELDQTKDRISALEARSLGVSVSKRPLGHITSLGRHSQVDLVVRKGDKIIANFYASAQNSEFYYRIVDASSRSVALLGSSQVVQLSGQPWRSIGAQEVFVATADGPMTIAVEFFKSDVSGAVRVFGPSLSALVMSGDA